MDWLSAGTGGTQKFVALALGLRSGFAATMNFRFGRCRTISNGCNLG